MAEVLTIEQDGLNVREENCGAFWQVSAWPGTAGAVASMVGDVTGADAPGPGAFVQTDAGTVARIGPLVWWIIGAGDGVAGKVQGIDTEQGAALNLTDNRTRFVVSGTRARDVMMRLSPLDFRDRAFPAGHIASTSAHHMSVQILRREEAWEVYVTSTFARGLGELIAETAAQWG